MKTELNIHERSLTLHRFPKRSNETLQAWDAGDEYLINHVEELALPPVKIHCSVLAEDAVKAAINDYRKKNGLPELVQEEKIVH